MRATPPLSRSEQRPKASWVERCTRRLLAKVPGLSEEDSRLAAEDLWEASHWALTPEQAADLATGKTVAHAREAQGLTGI